MKIKIRNIDEWCNSLEAVTSSKPVIKDKYNDDGLFSERIFGPVRTSVCGCGYYHGRDKIGQECIQCKRKILFSSERRRTFAKIELPFPVLNPLMYHLICKAGKIKAQKLLDDLLYSEKIFGYLYREEDHVYYCYEKQVKDNESDDDEECVIPEGEILLTGLQGIKTFVENECERYKDENEHWKYINDNIENFYVNNVIVIPPEFRPMSKTKDSQRQDELNKYYHYIINSAEALKSAPFVDGEVMTEFSRHIQRHLSGIYDFIFSKLGKKRGLIRAAILGKRVDYSARAVITPDPKLSITRASIPYVMALELYKLEISNLLIQKKIKFSYEDCIEYIDKCIETYDESLYDLTYELIKKHDKHIILNRQPTLHRPSIQGYEEELNKDNSIKIPNMCVGGYNADFDGDQMAAHRPLSEECEQEVKDLMTIHHNLISPSTGNVIINATQDILLGLYIITKLKDEDKLVEIPEKFKHKVVFGDDKKMTTAGRILFNEILPDDYVFINDVCTKKVIGAILNNVSKNYDSNISVKLIDDIKDLGLLSTTRHGTTMSLKNMKIENIYDKVCSVVDDPNKTLTEKITELNEGEFIEYVKTNFPYSDFINSGSRGSWDQASQIISCRGYVSNFDGSIVEEPIKNNLLNGLTPKEFFLSCYGSRKGLLDTAINTGTSGHLTRKLIYCGCNLELDENIPDCGTKKCVEYDLTKFSEDETKKLIRSLRGKNVIVEKGGDKFETIISQNPKFPIFYNCKLFVRSPIFCTSKKICKKCYGDTSNLHSPYIGILSGQAAGEISTQMVLRTFHKSGSVSHVTKGEGDDEDMNDDIVFGLTRARKLFGATGNHTWYETLNELYKMYYEYDSDILMVHFEVLVAQMMRSATNPSIRWRLTDQNENNIFLSSVDSVPSHESWLLGLAFSKPKYYIIDGLVTSGQSQDGILEKLIVNKKFI